MGLTVKVFVGVEYECPRGHRFISASPEKAVKPKNASSSSAAAAKLVSSDIPLYMPCPCRASSKLECSTLS
jgi:protein SMG8